MPEVKLKVKFCVDEVINLEAKRIAKADEQGSKQRWPWMRDLLSLKSVEIDGKQVDITLADKAVGCFIAACLNTDEERGPLHKAWPSEDTIAESIGLHKRSVRRSVAKLQAISKIYVERRGGGIFIDDDGKRRGRPNLYSVRYGEVVVMPAHQSPKPVPLSPIPGLPGATSTILDYSTRNKTTSVSVDRECEPTDTESVAPSEESIRCKKEQKGAIPIPPMTPPAPIESDPLVRKAISDEQARVRVGTALAEVQGFEYEGKLPDGRYAEVAFVEMLKPSWLQELKRRCRAGTLTYAEIARAAEAAGLPKAEPDMMAA